MSSPDPAQESRHVSLLPAYSIVAIAICGVLMVGSLLFILIVHLRGNKSISNDDGSEDAQVKLKPPKPTPKQKKDQEAAALASGSSHLGSTSSPSTSFPSVIHETPPQSLIETAPSTAKIDESPLSAPQNDTGSSTISEPMPQAADEQPQSTLHNAPKSITGQPSHADDNQTLEPIDEPITHQTKIDDQPQTAADRRKLDGDVNLY